jgi:molybdopterin molybdotransferase
MVGNLLLPLAEALRVLDNTLAGYRPVLTEWISTREAGGRRLAVDEQSRLDLPPFDKAAMDGYAVLGGDERDEYKLLGVVAAGTAASFRLVPGTAVKVMTGAPVPDGCGRVIERERARESDGLVWIESRGASVNICWRAEDVQQGQLLLKRGRRLGAVEIATLIACGVNAVKVYKPVTLALISTGAELADGPAGLDDGMIINCNGPLLTALAADHGLAVGLEATIGDDADLTARVLGEALNCADIVVISGGVSEGDYDCVPGAVRSLGMRTHFNRLAVKPGKPTLFASATDGILLGLPGNPVAVYLMFHLLVLRAAGRLCRIELEPRFVEARLLREYSCTAGHRATFLPARLTADGALELLDYHGSAHLSALIDADGFALVPAGVSSLAAGAGVSFMPLGGRWGDA